MQWMDLNSWETEFWFSLHTTHKEVNEENQFLGKVVVSDAALRVIGLENVLRIPTILAFERIDLLMATEDLGVEAMEDLPLLLIDPVQEEEADPHQGVTHLEATPTMAVELLLLHLSLALVVLPLPTEVDGVLHLVHIELNPWLVDAHHQKVTLWFLEPELPHLEEAINVVQVEVLVLQERETTDLLQFRRILVADLLQEMADGKPVVI
jgi:hypothetical protein